MRIVLAILALLLTASSTQASMVNLLNASFESDAAGTSGNGISNWTFFSGSGNSDSSYEIGNVRDCASDGDHYLLFHDTIGDTGAGGSNFIGMFQDYALPAGTTLADGDVATFTGDALVDVFTGGSGSVGLHMEFFSSGSLVGRTDSFGTNVTWGPFSSNSYTTQTDSYTFNTGDLTPGQIGSIDTIRYVVNGFTGSADYNAKFDDLSATLVSASVAVPEPNVVVMFASACVALLVRRRKVGHR